ncbi:EF hand domain-containing protein [Luteimonas cucumeris]|uniref:EF hand domain-containing protein n=1 Tax=Luteimonas cucumeris TaxID=985012 RepID=A0A562LEA7_9GAMM|nr:EF-hand domain-containing protein [Luteimonas cucumeris]TWI05981.1 EF hand domain-containing protein [Luteimonas cucumeris]
MNIFNPPRNVYCTLMMIAGISLPLFAHANEDKAKSMDADGDGRITATEHAAGAKAMFERMDANRDGIVTSVEMDASHAAKKQDGKARSGMSSADKIKAVDTNNDGRLSAAEHEAGAKAMFSKMDTDKDGSVSAAEMKAGHAAMDKDSSR